MYSKKNSLGKLKPGLYTLQIPILLYLCHFFTLCFAPSLSLYNIFPSTTYFIISNFLSYWLTKSIINMDNHIIILLIIKTVYFIFWSELITSMKLDEKQKVLLLPVFFQEPTRKRLHWPVFAVWGQNLYIVLLCLLWCMRFFYSVIILFYMLYHACTPSNKIFNSH